MLELLDHDLLFRWFVGLGIDDAISDPTTFGKNRDRLLTGDVTQKFVGAVLAHSRVEQRRDRGGRRTMSHAPSRMSGRPCSAAFAGFTWP